MLNEKLIKQLECGPTHNVMAALPNIGGTLCESSITPFLVSRLKVWLTPAAGVPCINAANIGEHKTWTQSEFCTWQNSIRRQKPLKMYMCASPGDGQTSCKVLLTSVERCRCSNEVFSASRMQHISDMHSKFTLRPHHVWKYGRHPISDRWD